MTHEPIGVALIGAGMIASSHIQALSAASDLVTLKAIVSRNPDKARPLAELYAGPAPEFTSDLDAIAARDDIGMVIVATPPSVRRDLIGQMAKAGKHILLEKPVGRNLAEAREVVDICRGSRRSSGCCVPAPDAGTVQSGRALCGQR